MLKLAFDTATTWGRFALAEDERLLAYRPLNVSGSYADALLPVIDNMLRENGFAHADIDAVGVTVGPGSFTGVRIGVATAKGLAWGLGCDLVGVTSLAAMAAALLSEHPRAEYAVPALDARRQEIFGAVYRRAGDWVEAVAQPAAARPQAWWDIVTGVLDEPDGAVFGGDGSGLLLGQGRDLRPELVGKGEPVRRTWSTAHPATAAALAAAMGSGAPGLEPVHPFTLLPRYLRGSDAEVKRNLDLTPETPSEDIQIHRGERPGS